ncbi:Alpha-aminoadipate--LysW ligase LysX [Posidoniimonas polymericola]|uniref:Alpha-aminoadipate--LysW ligase LysX n=1 Tax=Posidoniimonas polymericola TaxID=2528002 RepID=A0A5C5YUL2_9BACT|nr:RimK family alpha-L-glutamate ligase [Posidoniimonas polymericola]TWT78247.1 Alpha-aminoadipate--LysW ligase LysX [Posidoniimonas polymericola]
MNVAVLGSPESWYFADLQRAAGSRWRLQAASFAELAAELQGPRIRVTAGEHDLTTCDGVLIRTMPPGSLEQVVFRMDALAGLQDAGVPVLNPPKAIEAAVDKHLALARLQAAGLPTPRTFTCQTAEAAAQAFVRLENDAVLKPLFGGEGRGITRLEDEAVASRVFRTLEQLGSVIYLQEYVPHHGADLRLLVVGDEVFGMRRVNPDDWRTNISRGAVAKPLEVTPDLADLARRSAAAVDAVVAGVDVLPALDGRMLVLEVNAVPGWRALSRTTGVDIAERMLRQFLVGR